MHSILNTLLIICNLYLKQPLLKSFFSALEICQKYYSWTYTNGVSETLVEAKEATKIFRVDFIEAERNSEAVYSETNREKLSVS